MKYNKSVQKRVSGFSLVEIMIAGSLLAGLGLGIATMFKQQGDQMARMRAYSSRDNLKDYLMQTIRNPKTIKNSLQFAGNADAAKCLTEETVRIVGRPPIPALNCTNGARLPIALMDPLIEPSRYQNSDIIASGRDIITYKPDGARCPWQALPTPGIPNIPRCQLLGNCPPPTPIPEPTCPLRVQAAITFYCAGNQPTCDVAEKALISFGIRRESGALSARSPAMTTVGGDPTDRNTNWSMNVADINNPGNTSPTSPACPEGEEVSNIDFATNTVQCQKKKKAGCFLGSAELYNIDSGQGALGGMYNYTAEYPAIHADAIANNMDFSKLEGKYIDKGKQFLGQNSQGDSICVAKPKCVTSGFYDMVQQPAIGLPGWSNNHEMTCPGYSPAQGGTSLYEPSYVLTRYDAKAATNLGGTYVNTGASDPTQPQPGCDWGGDWGAVAMAQPLAQDRVNIKVRPTMLGGVHSGEKICIHVTYTCCPLDPGMR